MNKIARLVVSLSLGLAAGSSSIAADNTLPWGQSADMIAWEEFVAIASPSGNPSTHKVEFETWASDEDIYPHAPKWPSVSAPKTLQASKLAQGHTAAAFAPQIFVPGPSGCQTPQGISSPKGHPEIPPVAAGSNFPASACIGEEVRRNWASFQYIVSNGLDSKAGRAKAFARGLVVSLPADAVEFKGDWVEVNAVAGWLGISVDDVRKGYYTNTAALSGKTSEYALLAFHISTKQIGVWVWSDFEGALNPGRCDVIGCNDSFGASIPVVAPADVAYQKYGACQKTAAVQAMMSSAGLAPSWSNYCLKGTQIAYIDSNGKATKLGNSVIETINAAVPINRSSCISCHKYAGFRKDGTANKDIFAPLNPAPTGDVTLPGDTMSNDFIWGILSSK